MNLCKMKSCKFSAQTSTVFVFANCLGLFSNQVDFITSIHRLLTNPSVLHGDPVVDVETGSSHRPGKDLRNDGGSREPGAPCSLSWLHPALQPLPRDLAWLGHDPHPHHCQHHQHRTIPTFYVCLKQIITGVSPGLWPCLPGFPCLCYRH